MSSSSSEDPRKSTSPAQAPSTFKISDGTIGGLAEVFKMLGDGTRLKILLALAHHGELHVTAICEALDETQPVISHHLSLLRMQRLVAARRGGKHNFYQVASQRIHELLELFFVDSGNDLKQIHFADFSLAYKRK